MQSDIVAQVLRRLAAVQRLSSRCSSSPTQLARAPAAKGLRPLYTVLRRRAAAGAGGGRRDPRRGARRGLRRAQGLHRRRRALRLERAARRGAGDEPVRRPPADRDPHPVGQAGQGRLARRCSATASHRGAADDVLTLVQLPRLDRKQQKSALVRALDAAGVTVAGRPDRARSALPAWIAQRLARQGQRVAAGEEGQRTLAFFADRVEGNLLAAHQEIAEAGAAAPGGRAELRAGRGGGAERRALRRLQARRGGARRAGRRARCACSTALRAEGEAPVLVHWTLAEDIRALKRVQGRARRRPAAAAGAAREPRLGRRRSGCSSACCRC